MYSTCADLFAKSGGLSVGGGLGKGATNVAILLVRNERFCLDEVFYLLVMDEAARFMGFVRVLIPLDYVGL
jgi:hypothetical protein